MWDAARGNDHAGGRSRRAARVSVFGTGGSSRPLPVARSLNGDVITSGRSFRSPDVCRDARLPVSDIAQRNRVRSLVIVPLPARGALLGTIVVARRAPWQFSARDEAVVQEFARSVQLSVQHASARSSPWLASPFTSGGQRRDGEAIEETFEGAAYWHSRLCPCQFPRMYDERCEG